MEKVISDTIEKFKSMPNIKFKEVSLPHTKYALAVYYIIMSSEVSANLSRYDGIRYGVSVKSEGTLEDLYEANRTAGFGDEAKRRIMLGTYSLSSGYFDQYYSKASKVRRLIKEDFENVFKEVDMILTPTTTSPAFLIGEKVDNPLAMYLSDIYTISLNLAGLPGVSFPVGKVRSLPVGMQVLGPAWSEATLLQFLHCHATGI